jgi:hypothetical protein
MIIRKLTLTKPNEVVPTLVANFELIVIVKPKQVDNAE